MSKLKAAGIAFGVILTIGMFNSVAGDTAPASPKPTPTVTVTESAPAKPTPTPTVTPTATVDTDVDAPRVHRPSKCRHKWYC